MIKKPEPTHIKGICVLCNINTQTLRETVKGIKRYRAICFSCHSRRHKLFTGTNKHRYYSLNKKDFCESCGFVAKHKCQLDVDHIDGNSKNNDKNNLQTLCANCHRLKTHNNREYLNTNKRN